MESMTKLNAELTQDYRLTSDGQQFILKRRRLIDPTKAPNWSEREAKGADPSIREEWENAGYYSLTFRGFQVMMQHVIMCGVAESDAQSLREISELIQRTAQRFTEALEPPISRSDYARDILMMGAVPFNQLSDECRRETKEARE